MSAAVYKGQARPGSGTAVPLPVALDNLLAALRLFGDDHERPWGQLTLVGDDPVFATRLRLGGAMAVATAAAAAAMAAVGRRRGLPAQDIRICVATAARNIFPEHNHAPRLAGRPFPLGDRQDSPFLTGLYATRDGRTFVPSALHPSEQARWGLALGIGPTPSAAAVRRAIAARTGRALERLADQAGLAGVCCYTPQGFRQHAHGRQLAGTPLVAAHPPWPGGGQSALAAPPGDRAAAPVFRTPAGPAPARPLAGLRVLVLGRVFAGPLVGRTLAEQGADVIYVGSAVRPELEAVYLEACLGGQHCSAQLRDPQARLALERLLQQAHVVVDNTRPGSLSPYGLAAYQLRARLDGLVHLRIDAFGAPGPWQHRSGYDMGACAAAGLLKPHRAAPARFLPSVLLPDFLVGQLGAAAVAAALVHGGGRSLRTSLCRAALWARSLGQISAARLAHWQQAGRCQVVRQRTWQTPLGPLRRPDFAAQFSHTPPCWSFEDFLGQGGRDVGCVAFRTM